MGGAADANGGNATEEEEMIRFLWYLLPISAGIGGSVQAALLGSGAREAGPIGGAFALFLGATVASGILLVCRIGGTLHSALAVGPIIWVVPALTAKYSAVEPRR